MLYSDSIFVKTFCIQNHTNLISDGRVMDISRQFDDISIIQPFIHTLKKELHVFSEPTPIFGNNRNKAGDCPQMYSNNERIVSVSPCFFLKLIGEMNNE